MINKDIIWQFTNTVNMWCNGLGYFNAKLITYIVKYKFLCFKWYRIKQVIPKVLAWYDGEYDSNRRARWCAKCDKVKAKIELLYYKKYGKWKE